MRHRLRRSWRVFSSGGSCRLVLVLVSKPLPELIDDQLLTMSLLRSEKKRDSLRTRMSPVTLMRLVHSATSFGAAQPSDLACAITSWRTSSRMPSRTLCGT
ncbi:Uncharacterised protein [Stenotrophomonas maltophilia]|nr:Uncharacterised protein [Stenotrophomonas maltophilia]